MRGAKTDRGSGRRITAATPSRPTRIASHRTARLVAVAPKFRFCSPMPERTPLGGTHARDFDDGRQQVPLSELTGDDLGYVRFDCTRCPRRGKIRLEALRARFAPAAGLVNILNAVAPKDCPGARHDAQGIKRCGFHYRGLR